MSELDPLIVTFQAQLLDVMESVLKTAMYKVTQLVEHGFLEEVKRRNQELETLRMKLEYAEIRLKDHGEIERKADGAFVDIESDDDGNTSEERLVELHSDVFMSCGGKMKSDSTERLIGSQLCESESEAEEPPAILTSEKEETHTEEHVDVMLTVDVKEEVHEESDSRSENMRLEAYAGDDQETTKNEVLSKNGIQTDLQISNVCNIPERLDTTDTTIDLLVKPHTGRTAITSPHHRVGSDRECDRAKPNCPNQLVDSIIEDGRSRDQICPSKSSAIQRLQNPDSLSVPIKQEVFMTSDDCVENQQVNKKPSTKSVFPCAEKQISKSHETLMPEELMLHSKDTTSDRLVTPIKHLSSTLKKPPYTLSNSTSSLPKTQSQASNLDPINRNPSTSKATPHTARSVQRDHIANKLNATLWPNNKSQSTSANSHHSYLLSNPNWQPVFRHSLRCGQCGKCFPHPSNLKAHLQTHTGERPFCCSLCGRSFTKLSNLKAHCRVHTGERPYCCLACGKRFTQKCNLKRHQRIHVD
ncbi:gastrula zinc finger protein XlCGF53.1 [Corythoichthys intestinalis]|uniref:gastrula zinc finger protein XlCGF53.1 n=1 Tax=Corythoichthys intestinalis TaxID=161448 RepID=UPI0025A4F5D4|nr:gastrula zinc finger protein XlCGF53.1 [Corythoichthys intestinalis]